MVQAARQPEKPKAVKPRRSLLRSGLGRRRASVHTGTDRVREKEILAATRSVLTERGYANFTLRGIAEVAGLSLSHLQYYFPTKAEIVSALFADVGNDYEQAYVAFLARIYGGPEERLSAWIEFLLDDSWDPETRRFFIQLWGLLESEADGSQSLLREFYEMDIEEISGLIAAARPELFPSDVRQRATLIAGAIEGMMLVVGFNEQSGRARRKMLVSSRHQLVSIALAD